MLSKKQLKRERKRERDKEKERIAKEETQDLQQSQGGNTDADIDANIPSKKRKVSVEDGGDGESPWKFEVDYNDHFETPKVAYADLLPVLQQVARDCKKPLAEVTTFLRL